MTITTLPLDELLSSSDAASFSGRRALSDVSLAIAKCKRAVVVSGAGISCSSGIPDFRSGEGLYSLVKARYPDAFVTGRDLFSSGLFADPSTTSLFYTFIAELASSCNQAEPTPTHHFIGKLESKGKLLRSYTQNIDGLERRIGLESGGRGKGLKKKGTKNVEMHGDLGRVRCVLCMMDFEAREDWMETFRDGQAPDCPSCQERSASRAARAARLLPIGTLRPSIVLYDEPHPLGEEIGALQAYDLVRSPDMLLIMGTSLKVHGLKKVVKAFAKAVHARKGTVVFVNATPPTKEWEGVIDIHVHGETDVWVHKVEEEWRRVRPQDWQLQTRLDGEVVKEIPRNKGKGKAKATDRASRQAQPAPVQLPTPRPSQSPKKSRPSSPLSSIESSAPSMPSTPLSPSKRRANVPPSPMSYDGNSPSTKKRALQPTVPSTGLPATPGRGNLFASPMESQQPQSDDWEDVVAAVEAMSPVKAKAKTTRKKSAVSGKENVKPIAIGGIRSNPRTKAAGKL